MGYDLPAALGALSATNKNRIICLAGDGSIMMNLQDLASLSIYKERLKIFLFNNDGYLSIKQTQNNFFSKEFGSTKSSGLNLPNFIKVAKAFGFNTNILSKKTKNSLSWKNSLKKIIQSKFSCFIDVKIDPNQEFEPRLKSRIIKNKIYTPELDDMYPFLPKKELESIRNSAKKIID
jgi:acetolactate synthase-1/2/3 large subunit